MYTEMNRHLDKMHKFIEKYKFTKTKEKKEKTTLFYNLQNLAQYFTIFLVETDILLYMC